MSIRNLVRVGLGLTIILGLLGVFSACGVGGPGGMWGMGGMDHESMHRQMHGGGELAPQTPVTSEASEATVEILDADFLPRDLTVSAGASVTWINRSILPHDATDEAGGWATVVLKQGESATLTFDSPGVYKYICSLHPNMKAVLTVS